MNRLEYTITAWPINGLPATLADRTRRVYDRLAAVYRISTMLFHSRAHRCALEICDIHDGMHVLEVATGSGEMFRRLVRANPGGATIGVDLSPNMAAARRIACSASFPTATTHCQAVDARHMPFRDETFDAVFCCYLLELLSGDDIVRTLREFRRVLRRRRPTGTGADRPEHGGRSTRLYFSSGQGGAGLLGPAGGQSAFPS